MRDAIQAARLQVIEMAMAYGERSDRNAAWTSHSCE